MFIVMLRVFRNGENVSSHPVGLFATHADVLAYVERQTVKLGAPTHQCERPGYYHVSFHHRGLTYMLTESEWYPGQSVDAYDL